MTEVAALNPDTATALSKQLQDLLNHNRGVKAALLATSDGFEVAVAGDFDGCEPSSAAAMASSMLSLSLAMVNETGLDECQNLIVEANLGRVLILSVPAEPASMLLTLVTNQDTAFGQLLLDTKITVQRLSRVLLSV